MNAIASDIAAERRRTVDRALDVLPSPEAWRLAAAQHDDLFAPLDSGVRIALLAREAPTQMLVWEALGAGIAARVEPFASYSTCGADIVLAADGTSLPRIRAATDGKLFDVLRAGVRSGHIVCYMLKRRCVLEERGLDELLDALGFAFMGACR